MVVMVTIIVIIDVEPAPTQKIMDGGVEVAPSRPLWIGGEDIIFPKRVS
jgi:hypothetical protein